MIKTNLLYSRAITPAGRIVNEPTFLGMVLIGIALLPVIAFTVYGAFWLISTGAI